MLVLSRKYQDTIVIDQRIRIKVLAIRGDRIRLGIEAPDDVAILRGELTLTRRGCEKMGLAPSGNGENPGKPEVAKVPVPIFSQPRLVPFPVVQSHSTAIASPRAITNVTAAVTSTTRLWKNGTGSESKRRKPWKTSGRESACPNFFTASTRWRSEPESS
jgi:carbon storage regulator